MAEARRPVTSPAYGNSTYGQVAVRCVRPRSPGSRPLRAVTRNRSVRGASRPGITSTKSSHSTSWPFSEPYERWSTTLSLSLAKTYPRGTVNSSHGDEQDLRSLLAVVGRVVQSASKDASPAASLLRRALIGCRTISSVIDTTIGSPSLPSFNLSSLPTSRV
jgi:hypothetical protein